MMHTTTHTAPPKYECSDDLFALLKALRKEQNAFFKAPHGTFERTKALENSRHHERELDKFLKSREGPFQTTLF